MMGNRKSILILSILSLYQLSSVLALGNLLPELPVPDPIQQVKGIINTSSPGMDQSSLSLLLQQILNITNTILLQGMDPATKLQTVLDIIDEILDLKNFIDHVKEGVTDLATCVACQILFPVLKLPLDKETLASILKQACIAAQLSTERACNGLIDQYKDSVLYIVRNSTINTNEMCGVLLGVQCLTIPSGKLYWKINITNKNITNTTEVEPNKTYKISHVTDVHMDPLYKEGSEVVCGEPICCRDITSNVKNKSGYWGTYPCDIPIYTVDNSLNEIYNKHPDIDLWYWTGDIVPHDIWQYSKNTTIATSKNFTDLLTQYTQNKTVIPAIGNHEGVPCNCFPPPSITGDLSIQWLYDALAVQWKDWLPTQALTTLKLAGYYSWQIRTGFRVIVLNTNFCARLNFWSLFDPVDPAGQLKWLNDELLAAEEAGDKVHIVGHIPPDKRECTQAWVKNFVDLCERFEDTIVGQFYGHTHFDEIRVLFSNSNSSKCIGFEFVSPSLSTYDVNNCGYRLLETNSKGEISRVDTYYFNLTLANQKPNGIQNTPIWKFEYSMSDSYSMTGFTNQAFCKLIYDLRPLALNDTYFQSYYNYYYRMSDAIPSPTCDLNCKKPKYEDTLVWDPYGKQPNPLTDLF